MTDFFTRMFALEPSDDEGDSGSYSTNEFLEAARGRKQGHSKRRAGRSRSLSSSSTSSETKEDYPSQRRSNNYESGRKKYREKQRRNDHHVRSESRRHSRKSQSSSSPSMKLHLHSPSRGGDRRSSKDSSKKADDNITPAKKKWRSKLSGGVKKHLSPGQSSAKAKSRQSRSKREGNRNAPQKQPINIGDSITISQQFLEETDVSVLTIPKELAMEDDDLEEDNDDHLDLRRVESAPMESNHTESIENQFLTKSMSRDRMSEYASRLLQGGRLYTDEGVEVSHEYQNAWPDDVSQSQRNNVNSPHVPSSPPPPPPPSSYGTTTIRRSSPNNDKMATPRKHDPPGLDSPDIQLSRHRLRRRSDPPTFRGEEPFDDVNSGVNNAKTISKDQSKSKSVTFSLPPPPPSDHRAAPPFMGPPFDFYYSLERDETEVKPLWSPSQLMPPIMELWSSVECGEYGPRDEIQNELLGEENQLHVSSDWLDVCDNDCEDISVPGTSVHSFENQTQTATPIAPASVGKLEMESEQNTDETFYEDFNVLMKKKKTAPQTLHHDSPDDEIDSPLVPLDVQVDSPDDEYFDAILNCDGDYSEDGVSKERVPCTEIVTQSAEIDDDTTRHRSSWRSAYNMTYKPPPPHMSFNPARYLSDEILLTRFRSAVLIQSSMRTFLRRQRYSKLRRSTLVLQSFIRSYLFRQRLCRHIKLKSTYTSVKWRDRKKRFQKNG